MTKNPVMQDDGQFHELADLLHEAEDAERAVRIAEIIEERFTQRAHL